MKRLILVAVLLLLMGGCAATSREREALEPAVLRFNSQIRWGRLEEVISYVPPAMRHELSIKLASLEGKVKIVSYEVISTQKADRDVLVFLRFTWIREEEGVVLKSWLRERWVYENERWLCTSMVTVKGEPWPLEFEAR